MEVKITRLAEQNAHLYIGKPMVIKTGPNSKVEGVVTEATVLGVAWRGLSCRPRIQLTMECGSAKVVQKFTITPEYFPG